MAEKKTFLVVEVQDCRRFRRWVHTVQAETEEEAMEAAMSGDGEVDDGEQIGDEEYGESGWANAKDEDDIFGAEDRAMEDGFSKPHHVEKPETN